MPAETKNNMKKLWSVFTVFISRFVKSFVLLLSFAGLLLGATNANALACTSAATGLWSVAATWAAPCNIAGGPVAADTVTIAAAHTVTVDVSSAATSVAIAAPSVAAHGIDINPGIALNVSGAITMTAPAVNGRTSTLAVGSGTLAAGSILINGGGTATRIPSDRDNLPSRSPAWSPTAELPPSQNHLHPPAP
jgi:hypothetical protein